MELKDRIIDSAYELFATKGYEKSTIEAIIIKAQCAKGGFYHHFKSKEEILEVIINNYINELKTSFDFIEVNAEASFFDRFNDIFTAISRYKLRQLTEWSKVNNIFIFEGNEKILRFLTKGFRHETTKIYLNVINRGKQQGEINIEHPEILAEFCAREIMWIFEAVAKPIHTEDIEAFNMFINVLELSEELISHGLGIKKQDLKLKEVAISYLNSARECYLKNRGEKQ